MFKSKVILLAIILIISISFSYAAKKQLTPEEQALRNKLKAERLQKSEAADKLIRHTSSKEFEKVVLNNDDNLWIVFYGSKKCPHTQKFNPKWLQFQENMDNGLYNFENIKITKIECYGEQFNFCVSQGNQYWPELMFYYRGVKKGTYDGEDEIEDIVKYIKEKKESFMKEEIKKTKTVKSTKGDIPKSKPAKKPAPAKTTKNPPPSVYDSKKIEETKKVPTMKEDNGIIGDNDNNEIDETIDNSIDDKKNEDTENGIEDDEINGGSKNANTENDVVSEQNKGSSNTLIFSIGGCAACVAGFLFAKKRYRGNGYSRVGGDNNNRTAKYKYDKHIV